MLRRVVSRSWAAPTASSAVRWVSITPVPFPSYSPTMEKGTLINWTVDVGTTLESGTEMARVETDKATVGFENMEDGAVLARKLVADGTTDIQVGTIVALMVDDPADVKSPEVANWKPTGEEEGAASPSTADAAPEKKADAPQAAPAAASRADGERVFASPLARKTAAELGVDVSKVAGTGGAVGRVTKLDVVKASEAGTASASASPASTSSTSTAASKTPSKPATAAKQQATAPAAGELYETIPITGMRRTIATRLTQAKNVDVPHYYLTRECNVENMLTVVKQLNAKGKGEYKITVNDYLIKAIARANLIVPECNTHWLGDSMRRYETVDVSVAVATPTGLITPIVKDAHAKGLAQISAEVKSLAKAAKEGTLKPEQYQGGTVAISNLGGIGIDNFTAIINPPHSMILAVGSTLPKPEIVQKEDGEFELTGKVVRTVSCTASFDHRVVDGAVGAQWFKHFKDAVENPLSLLL